MVLMKIQQLIKKTHNKVQEIKFIKVIKYKTKFNATVEKTLRVKCIFYN